MIAIYILLIVGVILTLKFIKGKKRIVLISIITLSCIYCIVLNIDMYRVKTYRNPIFAIETDTIENKTEYTNIKKYTGIGYKVQIEEVMIDNVIIRGELILLKWKIAEARGKIQVIEIQPES